MRRRAQPYLPASMTLGKLEQGPPVPQPSEFARFGKESWIVPPSVIERPRQIEIGDRTVILEGTLVEMGPSGRLVVGNGVRLTRFICINCSLSITLEDEVSSSDGATIIDSWGPTDTPQPVRVEAGAYLGAWSVVGPGVTVGSGAFIGERSVVVEDVEPHTVVYGNPATVVRRLEGSAWVGPRLP